VSLSGLRGKTVVLYFDPKADTYGSKSIAATRNATWTDRAAISAAASDLQNLPFDALRADRGMLCIWDMRNLTRCCVLGSVGRFCRPERQPTRSPG
jgi:hypothetical protein